MVIVKPSKTNIHALQGVIQKIINRSSWSLKTATPTQVAIQRAVPAVFIIKKK
jgi:hypothetical protein